MFGNKQRVTAFYVCPYKKRSSTFFGGSQKHFSKPKDCVSLIYESSWKSVVSKISKRSTTFVIYICELLLSCWNLSIHLSIIYCLSGGLGWGDNSLNSNTWTSCVVQLLLVILVYLTKKNNLSVLLKKSHVYPVKCQHGDNISIAYLHVICTEKTTMIKPLKCLYFE